MVELMKRPEVLQRAASIAGLASDAVGMRRISVRRVGATNLIGIDVDSTDPLRASTLADAIAQSTVEVNLEGRRRQFTDVRKYIETQVDETSHRLRSIEESIARFRSEGRNVTLSQETAVDVQRISELQSQRLALQLDIRNLQEDMRQNSLNLMFMPTAAGSPDATEMPIVKALRDQLSVLEVELAGLRAQFTAKYPEIKAAEAKVQEIQQLLRQEGADQMASLKAQQRALEIKDNILGDAIQQLESRIEGVPLQELELEKLTREQKVNEGNYVFLAQKLQEARIEETSVGSEVQLVSPAAPPTRPVKPNKPLNTVIGCMVGLCLGIGAALIVERLDDTLKNKDDVERNLGVPILGVVPSVRRTERLQ
jgi:polysaccharide biosynthesis transport protein